MLGFDVAADPCAGAARHWRLDPEVTFLNHGSFGACPAVLLERQAEIRRQLEAEPIHFFLDTLPVLAARARAAVAAFVGASPDDLAFVTNATSGVNTVLRSFPFEPGDQVLVTDHAYHACRNALQYAADASGARVVVARVPFPVDGPDTVVEAVLHAVTPDTRLALLDHVTSPTGLVLPIERLVSVLEERGVEVLVDGAHAMGMVPLALDRLGASYYTSNAHKWLCAPKGVAILWVRRDRQDRVRPLVISHGADEAEGAASRFRAEADWTGTHDPSPYLVLPEALAFLGSLTPDGVPGLMARNRALVLEGRRIVSEALEIDPPSPEGMIASLASFPIPAASSLPAGSGSPRDPLQQALWEHHRIEVPVIPWPQAPSRLLRISAQAYNTPAQYATLASALRSLA